MVKCLHNKKIILSCVMFASSQARVNSTGGSPTKASEKSSPTTPLFGRPSDIKKLQVSHRACLVLPPLSTVVNGLRWLAPNMNVEKFSQSELAK